MNRYELTDEIRKTYKPIIAEFLNKIDSMTNDELANYPEEKIQLDLSDTKLNPYTLGEILEKDFNYDNREQDDNGWQFDFWITYTKPSKDRTRKVTISGTGIIFEMFLCVEV